MPHPLPTEKGKGTVMLLSTKWLKEFVEIDPSVSDRAFCEAMTMSGSKVETFEHEDAEIKKVVCGRVLSMEKHPDADKLVICQVSVGGETPLQIVTGAKNVVPGAWVPVAMDGSTLPGGVHIKTGKLRGVLSQGMMCSLSELGLTVNDFPYAIEDGIFLLQEPCTEGQNACEALGLDDMTVDFEITSNRPDCLSVIGLEREAAATFRQPLRLHEPMVKGTPGAGNVADVVRVTVEEPELCTRYCARAVKNVKIASSPRWLRERLRASGVRPINNIVDITNYVMLEYGQPMHSFDARFLEGGAIEVRRARQGEAITTLDGVQRALTPDMLVIADSKKPVAVAGVMGGEYSGIMPDTQTIVFESAMFDGASVRLTSRRLGLRSESSSRFEKGLDAAGCRRALDRACELVELLGAGEVCEGVVDVDHSDKTPFTLALEPEWISRFLGISVPQSEMEDTLRRIGFGVENGMVTVPTFRNDVRHKADVAEEIARFYGYDKIPVTLIDAPATMGGFSAKQKFENKLLSLMTALGFTEICTYSFFSPKAYGKIGLPENDPLRSSVRIRNPLGEDTGIMRTTALPSMLETLARNYNNRLPAASLFELAGTYLPREGSALPDERQQLTLGLYGPKADFYALKGAVEELALTCGIKGLEFAAAQQPGYHPGRCARMTIDGETLGTLGEIHPAVRENYGMETRVFAATLDVALLYAHTDTQRTYQPLPKFPATARDLALLCDEETPVAELEKAMRAGCGKILEQIELFDVYRGSQIPAGKKSVAFNVRMRAADRTLTDDEADRAVQKMLKALAPLGAVLRS